MSDSFFSTCIVAVGEDFMFSVFGGGGLPLVWVLSILQCDTAVNKAGAPLGTVVHEHSPEAAGKATSIHILILK